MPFLDENAVAVEQNKLFLQCSQFGDEYIVTFQHCNLTLEQYCKTNVRPTNRINLHPTIIQCLNLTLVQHCKPALHQCNENDVVQANAHNIVPTDVQRNNGNPTINQIPTKIQR